MSNENKEKNDSERQKEMFLLVKDYHKSETSMRKYCNKNGIKFFILQYWNNKYSDKYEPRIVLRISKEERKIIKEKAKLAGEEEATYIKNIALNRKMKSITDASTLAQIRKIGSNINQIARKINSSTVVSNPKKFIEELGNYRLLLDEILKKL
jgi:hypothetical protein